MFGGLALLGLIVVGFVTYERRKYRKQFRERKAIENAQNLMIMRQSVSEPFQARKAVMALLTLSVRSKDSAAQDVDRFLPCHSCLAYMYPSSSCVRDALTFRRAMQHFAALSEHLGQQHLSTSYYQDRSIANEMQCAMLE